MKSMNYISSNIEVLNLNQLRFILGGDGDSITVDEQDNDTPDITA